MEATFLPQAAMTAAPFVMMKFNSVLLVSNLPSFITNLPALGWLCWRVLYWHPMLWISSLQLFPAPVRSVPTILFLTSDPVGVGPVTRSGTWVFRVEILLQNLEEEGKRPNINLKAPRKEYQLINIQYHP